MIKKVVDGNRIKKGSWVTFQTEDLVSAHITHAFQCTNPKKDSINVIEAVENDKVATYKLTTTVMLHMDVHKDEQQIGSKDFTKLAGSLTRQANNFFCYFLWFVVY